MLHTLGPVVLEERADLCIRHCRIFSSFPNLYPLDASSNPVAQSWQPNQTLPKCFLGGTVAPGWEPLDYLNIFLLSAPFPVFLQFIFHPAAHVLDKNNPVCHSFAQNLPMASGPFRVKSVSTYVSLPHQPVNSLSFSFLISCSLNTERAAFSLWKLKRVPLPQFYFHSLHHCHHLLNEW